MAQTIRSSLRTALLAGAAALSAAAPGSADDATDDAHEFAIAAQSLDAALQSYALQSGREVFYDPALVSGRESAEVRGVHDDDDALEAMLANAELDYVVTDGGAIMVVDPEASRAAAGDAARPQRRTRLAQADGTTTRRARTLEDEDATSDRDVITVTGSHIRGLGFGASPGRVIDRAEIERNSFGTVAELMNALPQHFNGGQSEDNLVSSLNNQTLVGNISGASGVNLRGLGTGTTLTLVNGRRLAPSNLGDVVDISAIPLSAIERVEVLTDGASAIYGSDAIGGVVNFILRDDYEGAETKLRYGAVTDGDMAEYSVAQTLGEAWGTGNVLASYEYFHTDNLSAEDRDFASSAFLPRDLLAETDRHSVLLSGRQELSPQVGLFADAAYTRRESPTSNSSGVVLLEQRPVAQMYAVSGGVSIGLPADWTFDLTSAYSRSNTERDAISTIIPLSLVQTSHDDITSTLLSIDAKADGALFALPGGDVRLAVGASYREEELDEVTDSAPDFNVSRNVNSVFGEVLVPIVGEANSAPGLRQLDLTLAVRHDEYSDFGDSTDPKVGLLWSPADGVRLRGTYGTSFKAPTFFAIGGAPNSSLLQNLTDPSAPGGQTYTVTILGSNRDLGPEEAETWTAGIDFAPPAIPGLNARFTYYDVEFTDRIARPTANLASSLIEADTLYPFIDRDPSLAYLTALFADPEFDNLTYIGFYGPFTDDPADVGAVFDNRYQNVSLTHTDGIDFDLSYRHDAFGGSMFWNLSGSYILELEQAASETSPPADLVDTIFYPVDLRVRGGAGWSRDRISGNVFVNYVDSYTDNTTATDVEVDAWTTVDAKLTYRLGDVDNMVFRGVDLSLGASNLLDEDPPTITNVPTLTGIGYDPTNASPQGRMLSVEIRKSW